MISGIAESLAMRRFKELVRELNCWMEMGQDCCVEDGTVSELDRYAVATPT